MLLEPGGDNSSQGPETVAARVSRAGTKSGPLGILPVLPGSTFSLRMRTGLGYNPTLRQSPNMSSPRRLSPTTGESCSLMLSSAAPARSMCRLSLGAHRGTSRAEARSQGWAKW